jgi:voltage-gated potassium channel
MSTAAVSESRVQRWERRGEWPLAVAAAMFLTAYAWPILDTHLSTTWRHACTITDYTAWAIFIIDYLVRITIATNRLHYWVRHLHDLAIIALPVLRPLRLLRLVMLLRVLNRTATDSLRGRVAIYVSGAAVLLVFCASLAELDAERHAPKASITSFGEALWWAITTITTVGYGDLFPVTTEGRFVAAGLMIGGIALIGVITASIASWLIDRVRQAEADAQAPTLKDLHAIHEKIDALSQLIRDQQTNTHQQVEPTQS